MPRLVIWLARGTARFDGRARATARFDSALFGVALALLTSACGHVRPYEREHLSRPNMTPADEAHEAQFQAHLRESREGASAGSSAAGGGCGCN